METGLDALGIYELREYARRLGVKSPTTKVRAQLIKEIYLISKGKKLEGDIEKQTSKGRPPKRVLLDLDKNGYLNAPPVFKLEYYNSFAVGEEVKEAIDIELEKFSKRITKILENAILKFDNKKK